MDNLRTPELHELLKRGGAAQPRAGPGSVSEFLPNMKAHTVPASAYVRCGIEARGSLHDSGIAHRDHESELVSSAKSGGKHAALQTLRDSDGTWAVHASAWIACRSAPL